LERIFDAHGIKRSRDEAWPENDKNILLEYRIKKVKKCRNIIWYVQGSEKCVICSFVKSYVKHWYKFISSDKFWENNAILTDKRSAFEELIWLSVLKQSKVLEILLQEHNIN
jgi:hypothetical protein